MTIKDAIIKLTSREDLTFEMAEQVMDEIMTGSVSQTQIGAYLVALSMKGATIEEITASAKGMRKHATKLLHDQDVLEIVGTGGDKAGTFNISTTSALVLAAAGVQVAKHGNRAASSKCGSADVLEALGVKIDCSVEKSKEMLEKINICFLFAQCYHSAMRHVAPVRRELSVPTIFNILGPLSNPLGASMQLMGVYDETLIEPLAEVLTNLGVKKGMVVRGEDGLDEISMTTTTKVCEIRNGWFKSYEIDPKEYGFSLCNPEDLVGGTPEENAKITLGILKGDKSPKRDAVVLNSAAALYIARDNMTLESAILEIEEIIDSGKVLEKLNEFITMSNS
ncbi:MAG: anthranilate phosphoribosyltransferase [Eubacteriales bacterium]